MISLDKAYFYDKAAAITYLIEQQVIALQRAYWASLFQFNDETQQHLFR
jgi:hypothetical protein